MLAKQTFAHANRITYKILRIWHFRFLESQTSILLFVLLLKDKNLKSDLVLQSVFTHCMSVAYGFGLLNSNVK